MYGHLAGRGLKDSFQLMVDLSNQLYCISNHFTTKKDWHCLPILHFQFLYLEQGNCVFYCMKDVRSCMERNHRFCRCFSGFPNRGKKNFHTLNQGYTITCMIGYLRHISIFLIWTPLLLSSTLQKRTPVNFL